MLIFAMLILMENDAVVSAFIAAQKKALRSRIKLQLQDFFNSSAHVAEASRKASELFLHSSLYKNADIIMAFVSSKLEIDTSLILQAALADSKKLALPRVISDTEMDFFYVRNNLPLKDQLVSGAFGILEPARFLPKLEPDQFLRKSDAETAAGTSAPEKTLMLVPGLAFTKNGLRLGKGKGFYDRYFKRCMPSVLCGFCFDFQIVSDIPHTALDVAVSHLASSSALIACSHGL